MVNILTDKCIQKLSISTQQIIIHWSKNMIKGLRPVLESFVVPMHEGACETGSQILRALDVLFTQARMHWDNRPWQIGLNHDYNMTFSISPLECQWSPCKGHICAWSESYFMRSSHCYVTWCPLTMKKVPSQYPSSRDIVLVRRCLMPLILACLNTVKASLPQ